MSTGRSEDGLPNHSPPNSLYFGKGETSFGGGNYQSGVDMGGVVTSPNISLPSNVELRLRFNQYLELRNYLTYWEEIHIQLNEGGGFQTIATSRDYTFPVFTDDVWQPFEVDISQFSGKNIQLRFLMEVYDLIQLKLEGWYIDDIEIYSLTPQEDYYAFSAEKDEILSLALNGLETNTSVQIALQNAAGTVLTQGVAMSNTDSLIDQFKIPDDGTYYAYLKDILVDYSLLITKSAAFEPEPNDNFSEAFDITPSGNVLGYLSASNSSDHFLIEANAGELLRFQTFTPADGPYGFENQLDLALVVYDPSDLLVALEFDSMPDGRNVQFSLPIFESGNYHILIYAENDSGEYLLTVQYNYDSDGDGIPDYWEWRHGLNSYDPSDAGQDLDMDNQSNYEEYIADTIPTNNVSVLKLNITTTEDQEINDLSFISSKNRNYWIEQNTNLLDGIWSKLLFIEPVSNGWYYVDETNTTIRSFYRLGVELP